MTRTDCNTLKTRRSIVILGAPVSSANRGVLALGASLAGLLSRSSENAEIVVLGGRGDEGTIQFPVDRIWRSFRVIPCRMSPRAPIQDHFLAIIAMSLFYWLLPVESVRKWISSHFPWIKAIAEASLVGDIRGGDSFSDIYGMRRFLRGFVAASTVLMVRGSLVQFPQTYGPYRSSLARWLAKILLRKSSVIIARDTESQRVAQELAGPKRDVLLTPDVAFSLQSVEPESLAFSPPTTTPGVSGEIIGINVNALMFYGGYKRNNMFGAKLCYRTFLRDLIVALSHAPSTEIWLVPHTFGPKGDVESDPEASMELRESLPTRVRHRTRLLVGDYNPHELKAVIRRCDFFIGSRMHACIAALSQGIPCVGVAYSMKFKGVFETVGMGEWVIDSRSVSTEEAIKEVLGFYAIRDEVRPVLKERADAARATLLSTFTRFLGLSREAGDGVEHRNCLVTNENPS